jgi:putative multiple sugar transport system permease protein
MMLSAKKITVNFQQYTLIIVLLLLIFLFNFLTNGKVLTSMNMNNLIMQNSYVVVLAVGMLLCILLGGINLAVGSSVALAGGAGALLMMQYNFPVPLTIIIMLLLGILIGTFEGFFIAKVRIPPFIVTLADMMILRGIILVLLKSQTIGPLPKSFVKIGAGHFFSYFINPSGLKLDLVTLGVAGVFTVFIIWNTLRNSKKLKENLIVAIVKLFLILLLVDFYLFRLARHNGLPNVLIIITSIVLVYHFFTERMTAGRSIYAVGGNESAAKLSGISVDKVKFFVYVNCGLLSAVAGIILTARNASATPTAGENFELDAIASCFIGGASTFGGIGTVIGCIVGAFIMGVLNNGMSLMGLSVDWQRIVKGFVLLGAVTLDLYNKRH